jgi:hypothetical protein
MVTRWIALDVDRLVQRLAHRRSFSGFLPLTLEPGSSSRNWSMPKKMVRFSAPSITFSWGCAQARQVLRARVEDDVHLARQQRGMRVASDLMGV